MAIINYSKIAQQDLNAIYNYIRKDSLRYAHNEVRLIRETIQKLKSNSFLGKVFEESENELIRELIYKNYRIIYEIVSDTQINILTIHHHARSLPNNPAFTNDD